MIDWVGMDVKTRFHRYAEVTGVPGSGERARRSVELILASGVPHEFRTTVHPRLLPAEALEALADDLVRLGVRRYVLQAFRPTGCLSQGLIESTQPDDAGQQFHRTLASRFVDFSVRVP